MKELFTGQEIMDSFEEGYKKCIEDMFIYLEKENNGAYDESLIKDFISDFKESVSIKGVEDVCNDIGL